MVLTISVAHSVVIVDFVPIVIKLLSALIVQIAINVNLASELTKVSNYQIQGVLHNMEKFTGTIFNAETNIQEFNSFKEFEQRLDKTINGYLVGTDKPKLTNCVGCWSCYHCYDCIDCTDCYNCQRCINCSDCKGCIKCFDLKFSKQCSGCVDCTECFDCKGCTGCSDCQGCSECKNCVKCSFCENCNDCQHCFECISLVYGSGCYDIKIYKDTI